MSQKNKSLLILKIKFNFINKSQNKKCQGKKGKIFAIAGKYYWKWKWKSNLNLIYHLVRSLMVRNKNRLSYPVFGKELASNLVGSIFLGYIIRLSQNALREPGFSYQIFRRIINLC